MADGIESLKKPPLENDPVGSSTTVMKDASKSEFLGKEAELQAQAKKGDTKAWWLKTGTTITDILYLLGVLPNQRAPVIAFCRASRPQPRWGQHGELGLDDAGSCFLPVSIASSFQDIDEWGRDTKQLLFLTTGKMLALEIIESTKYISIASSFVGSGEWRQDPDRLLRRRFDFLSIILRAHPDAYSSVEWEEVASHMRGTIELNCLPLLRVISFDDIRKYVALSQQNLANESSALSQYLAMLLRFLAQLVGRYPFLKHLIVEILDQIDKFEDHLDLLPDIFHTRKVLEMYASAHHSEKAFNYVEELHKSEKPLTKQLNATIGIILGELICKGTSWDPLVMARESWKRTQLGRPSSLERIALAYLNDTDAVLQPIFQSSNLEIQTLTGFIHSKKRLFDWAKHILKGLLRDLGSQYGRNSMTFGLAVSEYVKCCNLTEDIADGEYWARYALFNRLDTPGAKTSADTLYLQVALADSLLAASKYESAIEILSDILQDAQSTQPSIVIMVSVRLCKARRRLGDPFPSRQMVTALPQDMKALGHVSKSLRLTYAEEIGCNLDSMDVSNDQRRKLHASFADLVIKSSSIPNEQDITARVKDFQELLVITSSKLNSYEESVAVDQHISEAIPNQTQLQTNHLHSQELSSIGSEHGLIESVVDLMELTSPAIDMSPGGAASKGYLKYLKLKQIDVNQSLSRMETSSAGQSSPQLSASTKTSMDESLSSLPTTWSDSPDVWLKPLPPLPTQIPSIPPSGETFPTPGITAKFTDMPDVSTLMPGVGNDLPDEKIPSFLFCVNDQRLNEDPQQGGIAPTTLVDPITGYWSPPLYANGFGEQTAGTLYRWNDGRVSRATDVPPNAGLTPFRAVTMFYCNPWTKFVVTDGDVSSRNVADGLPPQDRWYPLSFHHMGTCSYLDFFAEHLVLAGNRAVFIERLGLESYQNREEHLPRAGGLAGNLAMLIALIAFSCRRRDLDAVLMNDRAWRNHEWRGHRRPVGRWNGRGVFASIYLDYRNPVGSTAHTISELEWNMGALLC